MNTRWSKSVRTWHRWISLIVGLQLLLWTASGLIFSWDAIEDVRGETWISAPLAAPQPELSRLVSPEVAWRSSGFADLSGLQLAWRRDRWVWICASLDRERPVLIDALSGRPLELLTAEAAERTARRRFTEPSDVVDTEWLERAEGEYRGKSLPAWRVSFDDERHTNFYIDAHNGEVVSVRNDTWRRFDFFWMLHIMDYSDREDFHHPLLTGAAVLGVATSFSGLWLAVLVFWPRLRRRSRGRTQSH